MSPSASVIDFPAVRSYSPGDVQSIVNDAIREAESFVVINRIEVIDKPTSERAAVVRNEIGTRIRRIERAIEEPKSWAFKLHGWICGLEKAATAKYQALDRDLVAQQKRWKDAEDRRRQDAERQLAESLQRDKERRALDTAATLEQRGQGALAHSVLASTLNGPREHVSLPDDTKVSGQRWRTDWKWTLVGGDSPAMRDLLTCGPATEPSLAEAVELLLSRIPDDTLLEALGPALEREKALMPRKFLCFDETKINGIVTKQKEAAHRSLPPCIQVYSDQVPVRGR